jgi:hypothetical protein
MQRYRASRFRGSIRPARRHHTTGHVATEVRPRLAALVPHPQFRQIRWLEGLALMKFLQTR